MIQKKAPGSGVLRTVVRSIVFDTPRLNPAGPVIPLVPIPREPSAANTRRDLVGMTRSLFNDICQYPFEKDETDLKNFFLKNQEKPETPFSKESAV
jgi:hypothetical protein